MKLLAAILSWAAMAAACVLLSRGMVHYGFAIGVVAAAVHLLPPLPKLGRLSSYDPFFVLLPLWGVLVTAPREHWSDTSIVLTRIVAILLIVLVAGWCLFRDWHRFRISHETHVV